MPPVLVVHEGLQVFLRLVSLLAPVAQHGRLLPLVHLQRVGLPLWIVAMVELVASRKERARLCLLVGCATSGPSIRILHCMLLLLGM